MYHGIVPSMDYKAPHRERIRKRALHHLGGICSCGSIERLQFDHIDGSTKLFNISEAIRDGWSWERIQPELDKCQLLCSPCHLAKTAEERGVPHGGGLRGKRNCPCLLCKGKRAEYARNKRAEKRDVCL